MKVFNRIYKNSSIWNRLPSDRLQYLNIRIVHCPALPRRQRRISGRRWNQQSSSVVIVVCSVSTLFVINGVSLMTVINWTVRWSRVTVGYHVRRPRSSVVQQRLGLRVGHDDKSRSFAWTVIEPRSLPAFQHRPLMRVCRFFSSRPVTVVLPVKLKFLPFNAH